MTGIERLRALAYKKNFLEPAEARELDAIADQIEREQGGRVSRMRVLSVVTEMERHVLGHEGMEDSPVARWARELREALDVRDDEVTDVATVRKDTYDAYEWVCEHGGLDAVKRRWECLSYYADPVPRSCMERRLASRQRQIDESHAALRRRNERIKELNHRACDLTRENAELRKRAMPEGMCWPVFEDGEPVRIGGFVSDVEVRSVVFRDGGILLSDCTSVPGWGTWRSYKEPIKRPAPKVLDADGVEIRVGDTVYQMGCKYRVSHLHGANGKVRIVYENSGRWVDPKTLTHRAPVLAADGKPLREGETVWYVESGTELVVKKLPKPGEYQAVVVFALPKSPASHLTSFDPDQLTHERPESWERIEEDARSCTCVMEAIDLVRRARALSERDA